MACEAANKPIRYVFKKNGVQVEVRETEITGSEFSCAAVRYAPEVKRTGGAISARCQVCRNRVRVSPLGSMTIPEMMNATN